MYLEVLLISADEDGYLGGTLQTLPLYVCMCHLCLLNKQHKFMESDNRVDVDNSLQQIPAASVPVPFVVFVPSRLTLEYCCKMVNSDCTKLESATINVLI